MIKKKTLLTISLVFFLVCPVAGFSFPIIYGGGSNGGGSGSIDDGTAAGQMAFWDGATWTYTETSELFWDDTSKFIGINTASPNRRLEILDDSDNPQLRLSDDGSNYTDLKTNAAGAFAIFPTSGRVGINGNLNRTLLNLEAPSGNDFRYFINFEETLFPALDPTAIRAVAKIEPQVDDLNVYGMNNNIQIFGDRPVNTCISNYSRLTFKDTSAAVLDDFYGLRVDNILNQSTGSPTVTNAYAVYIDDDTFASNNYGIYQLGSSMINYFAGDIGIGTTSPDRNLEIIDASNPQLRLTHTDATDYTDFQVDTNGAMSVTPSGGSVHYPETTTPAPIADYWSMYGKADNALYFQDGAGVEHTVTLDTTAIGDGTSAGQLLFWSGSAWTNTETSELFFDDSSKELGINTASPDRRLEIIDDTNPQFRITHTDATDYTDFQVDTNGELTVSPSGGSVIFPSGSLENPSVSFGAGNSGFYESGEVIYVGLSGTSRFNFSANSFNANDTNGASILNEAASSTNPTIAPNKADVETGIGAAADDQLSFIAGGIEGMRINEATSTINVGINTDGTSGRMLEILDSNSQQLRLTTTEDTDYTDFNMGVGSMSFDTTGSTFIFKQGGAEKVRIQGGSIVCFDTEGPQMVNVQSQATTPTLIPNRQDGDTGVGHRDTDQLSLISGGVEAYTITEDTGAITHKLSGLVKRYTSESLADDAEITIETGTSGFGTVNIGDNQEYAWITWTTAGAVTLVQNSTNVVNTDTDANLCIYDAGSGIAIKNRLGSQLTVRFDLSYSN